MNKVSGFILLLVLMLTSSMAFSADADKKKTGYVRDKNPPEVEALIGKKFSGDHVPGWDLLRDTLLTDEHDVPPIGLVYLEHNGMTIFLTEIVGLNGANSTVLDAQVLPKEAEFNKETGELLQTKENASRYVFGYCFNSNDERLVGMMRPQKGKELCGHKTKLVQRAWKIDTKTGHITEISPTGVTCIWEMGENYCGN